MKRMFQWAIRDWVWLVVLIALAAMSIRQEMQLHELQVEIVNVDAGYSEEIARLHRRCDWIKANWTEGDE